MTLAKFCRYAFSFSRLNPRHSPFYECRGLGNILFKIVEVEKTKRN